MAQPQSSFGRQLDQAARTLREHLTLSGRKACIQCLLELGPLGLPILLSMSPHLRSLDRRMLRLEMEEAIDARDATHRPTEAQMDTLNSLAQRQDTPPP